MNDTAALLTVTSADPATPIWIGALATAILIVSGVLLWIRLSETPFKSTEAVSVVTLAALLWGALNWWAAPSEPTVNQAIMKTFSVDLDSRPDGDSLTQGAKLSGRSIEGDPATCLIVPTQFDKPGKILDIARLAMVVSGTVSVSCTYGPPPPTLQLADIEPPEPPEPQEDHPDTQGGLPEASTAQSEASMTPPR